MFEHPENNCAFGSRTQVNGRYAIMGKYRGARTATPMHFHAEDEIFHILEGL